MNKAIFLDRDGTLNIDEGYVHKVEDYKLHSGVIQGLKLLKDFKLFVVSNQSGIGRGYYKEEDMHKYNDHMLKDLSSSGINIENVFYCPHSPDDKCDCRKPNNKFVLEAQKEFDLDLKNSFVIGDHDTDIGLANNGGCRSIYLLTGHGLKHLKKARKLRPNYIAADFLQAVSWILFDKNKKVVSAQEISTQVDIQKKEGKKIVTINGTFDILHKGHSKILTEAKEQGDILIVGINSDSSVRENKGEDRPLNCEKERAKMVANFDDVDFVTVFEEKTPLALLERIKPDIHVNGSEYGKDCIEAKTVKKNGGKIHVVNLLDGFSTTKMITQ